MENILIFRLLKFIRPYLSKLLLASICMLFATLLNLLIPWAIKNFADVVLEKENLSKINFIAVFIIFLVFLRALFSYGRIYFVVYAGERMRVALRNKLYSHLLNLSLSFFDRQKIGDIISRITNDIETIEAPLNRSIINIIVSPLTLLGSIIIIFYLNWKLSIIAIVVIPAIVFIIRKNWHRVLDLSKKTQIKIADVFTIIEETLSSLRIVYSFNRKENEIEKFKKANEESFKAIMREVGLHASIPSLVDFLGWTGIVFVFWYGAHQAGVSGRIFEILDIKSDVKELPAAIALNNIRGSIEFRNVSYGYDKEDSQKLVLDNINFKIEEREKIALVGASGIGKTTIVNLLLRFYELQKGEILIDDINIKNIKISSLREQIGVVLQEPILFNTTIKENIRYGKLDAKDEEIIESAKIANAHSFIINLPDKYDTIVGDKGCRLSVGERQRICIARAIIKNPKILILDEPTSSIDREGEEKVFEAIKKCNTG